MQDNITIDTGNGACWETAAGLSETVRGGVKKERLLVVKSPLAPCSENCAPECDSLLQNQGR